MAHRFAWIVLMLALGCAPVRTPPAAQAPPILHHHALAFNDVGTGWTFGGGDDDAPLAPARTWRIEADGWRQAAAANPPPRATYGLAWTDRGLLMFGGWTPEASLGDTWVWDGVRWREARPPRSPSARNSVAMAYDRGRDRVVLFGGGEDDGGETWEWDGETWVRFTVADGPSARARAKLAPDPSGGVILFGGASGGAVLGDAWRWDGRAWRRLGGPTPPARANHVMAFHPEHGVLVYGGWRPDPREVLGDTWLWNGASWRRLDEPGPPPRDTAAMAWDSARGALVLHGGRDANGEGLFEVWLWDGAWRRN